MIIMSTLQQKLRTLISQHSDGPRAFASLLSTSHKAFFGTPLNESKSKALGAVIAGVKNAHVFSSLTNTESAVTRTTSSLLSLCTRTHDHIYGEGYFDFYYPVFTCDETSTSVGLFTTAHMDDDELCVRVTQSIKVFDDHTGEFIECVIAPCGVTCSTKLISADGSNAGRLFHVNYLNEDAQQRLQEATQADIVKTAALCARAKQDPKRCNVSNASTSAIRAIQTLELSRIIDAIGTIPHPDFTTHQSHLALFDGYVPYKALA